MFIIRDVMANLEATVQPIRIEEHEVTSSLCKLKLSCVSAAGSDIFLDCKNYEADNQMMLPGHIFVSKPGHLPCNALIHTVGPRFMDGQHNEGQKLYAAVYQALAEADRLHMRSVAMPTVTAAITTFPLEMSCDICFSAIKVIVSKGFYLL